MLKTSKTAKLIFFAVILSLLIAMVAAGGLLSGCLKLDYSGYMLKSSAKYELTKTDLFSLKENWKGTEVSVLGAVLGDTQEKVIDTIGLPDTKTTYGDNVVNFEYKDSLTLKGTGLLFHFKDNKLTRITVKKSFDKFLVGQTKISANTKQSIVNIFRAPSKVQLLSFFTVYVYNDRNLEVFLEGKSVNGFSFILPEAQEEFEQTTSVIKAEKAAAAATENTADSITANGQAEESVQTKEPEEQTD